MRPCIVTLALVLCSATTGAQENPHTISYYNTDWSPDSRRLAFESNRDGRFAIYTINVDGTGLKKLTSATVNDEQPHWSPDGGRIVFASDRDGHQQLYVMNADGSNQTRITNTAAGDDFYASFSPDGRWIVFSEKKDPKQEVYIVDVVRPRGNGRHRLTDSTQTSEGPQWSAEGKRIVFTQGPILSRAPTETPRQFVARRNKAMKMVSVRLDGSVVVPLTEAEIAAENIRAEGISPNKRWAAYTSEVNGASGVYAKELATGRERLLVGASTSGHRE